MDKFDKATLNFLAYSALIIMVVMGMTLVFSPRPTANATEPPALTTLHKGQVFVIKDMKYMFTGIDPLPSSSNLVVYQIYDFTNAKYITFYPWDFLWLGGNVYSSNLSQNTLTLTPVN